MKFTELPIKIQESVRETLKAYNEVYVYQDLDTKRLRTSTSIYISANPTETLLCSFKVEEIFNKEERILNYTETFGSYPIEYDGNRDYDLLKEISEVVNKEVSERDFHLEYNSDGDIIKVMNNSNPIKITLEELIKSSGKSIQDRKENKWDKVELNNYIAGVSNTYFDLINSFEFKDLLTSSESEELGELLSKEVDDRV